MRTVIEKLTHVGRARGTKPGTTVPGSSKVRWLAVCGLLLAASVPAYILYSYLNSPDRVVHQALAAARRNDASALVQLASDKEVRVLNLTPTSVEKYLAAIRWDEIAQKMHVTVSAPRPYYEDVLMFDVDVNGVSTIGKRRNTLYIYRDANGRWRLGLSMFLYVLPSLRKEVANPGQEWDMLARQAGIAGCTIPAGPTRIAANGSHNNSIKLTMPN